MSTSIILALGGRNLQTHQPVRMFAHRFLNFHRPMKQADYIILLACMRTLESGLDSVSAERASLFRAEHLFGFTRWVNEDRRTRS